jgi:hypothetical protein
VVLALLTIPLLLIYTIPYTVIAFITSMNLYFEGEIYETRYQRSALRYHEGHEAWSEANKP